MWARSHESVLHGLGTKQLILLFSEQNGPDQSLVLLLKALTEWDQETHSAGFTFFMVKFEVYKIKA